MYSQGRVAELQQMQGFYSDLRQHARLMSVVAETIVQASAPHARADASYFTGGSIGPAPLRARVAR